MKLETYIRDEEQITAAAGALGDMFVDGHTGLLWRPDACKWEAWLEDPGGGARWARRDISPTRAYVKLLHALETKMSAAADHHEQQSERMADNRLCLQATLRGIDEFAAKMNPNFASDPDVEPPSDF